MHSGDPIFFPCWDKSKPLVWKLRELHWKNKGGKTTAAAEEHKELPVPRTVPRGSHAGAQDHRPPGAGVAGRLTRLPKGVRQTPEIRAEIAGITLAPARCCLSPRQAFVERR